EIVSRGVEEGSRWGEGFGRGADEGSGHTEGPDREDRCARNVFARRGSARGFGSSGPTHDRSVGARQTSDRPVGSRVKSKRAAPADGPFQTDGYFLLFTAIFSCLPPGMLERSTP